MKRLLSKTDLRPGAGIYYFRSIFTLLAGVKNRWLLAKLALRFPLDRPFEVELTDGTRFRALTLMDVWVLKETLLDRVYEKVGVPLQMGWTVVDIGAAQGDFAVWSARQIKSGKVLAVEPFPQSVELLQENLALNGVHNVTIHEGAVDGSSGTLQLNLVTGEAAQHSTVNGQTANGQIDVHAMTLEALFLKYSLDRCDYLKMDCEGAEYNILFHSGDELFPKVERICMEVHDGMTAHSRHDMQHFLEEKGYSVKITPNPVHHNLSYLYAERRSNS